MILHIHHVTATWQQGPLNPTLNAENVERSDKLVLLITKT